MGRIAGRRRSANDRAPGERERQIARAEMRSRPAILRKLQLTPRATCTEDSIERPRIPPVLRRHTRRRGHEEDPNHRRPAAISALVHGGQAAPAVKLKSASPEREAEYPATAR